MNENIVGTADAFSIPHAPKSRFLGLQPIFDRHHRLYGHELLFRSSEINAFSVNPDLATRQVIDNYFLLTFSEPLGVCL